MKAIMDTGPWVALIDRSEGRHAECVQWFQAFQGILFSTEAVLTEVLYLLSFSLPAQFAAIDYVLKGAMTLIPSSTASLGRARDLMEKYGDIPMDFADATLVSAAEDLSILHVVTFDTRDFGIYRLPSKKPFIVLF